MRFSCRLGGAKRNPTFDVGFHSVPPNLQIKLILKENFLFEYEYEYDLPTILALTRYLVNSSYRGYVWAQGRVTDTCSMSDQQAQGL